MKKAVYVKFSPCPHCDGSGAIAEPGTRRDYEKVARAMKPPKKKRRKG